jgi:hypothetical protein
MNGMSKKLSLKALNWCIGFAVEDK